MSRLLTFAREMVRRPLTGMWPEVVLFRGCTEAILYRDGSLQAELVVIPPNVTIPRHRHTRVSSIDYWLKGDIDGTVGAHPLKRRRVFADDISKHLFPVPRGVWHGGTAGVDGVVYVSFQEWDGKPSFVSEDWEE